MEFNYLSHLKNIAISWTFNKVSKDFIWVKGRESASKILFKITLPFRLEWKLPFWHLKLPSSWSAFLQVENPLSDEHLLKGGFMHMASDTSSCLGCFGCVIHSWALDCKNGREQYWEVKAKHTELSLLSLWIWGHYSGIWGSCCRILWFFFQGALRSTWNKSSQIVQKHCSSEIRLKQI